MNDRIINPDNPYRIQISHLIKVLRNKEPEPPLFGVEKITVVLLAALQLILPSTLLRAATHHLSYRDRKRVIDTYAVGKVVGLCYLQFGGVEKSSWLIILTVVVLVDVLAHHLSRLLLPRLYPEPASVNRSIILLYINLLEVILCYASLYRLTDSIADPQLTHTVDGGMESFYFSFITFTTLGYGEFIPVNDTGKTIVLFEQATYFMFISTIIVRFVSQLTRR